MTDGMPDSVDTAEVFFGPWQWGVDLVEHDGQPWVLLVVTFPGLDQPVGFPLTGDNAERLGEILFKRGTEVRGAG